MTAKIEFYERRRDLWRLIPVENRARVFDSGDERPTVAQGAAETDQQQLLVGADFQSFNIEPTAGFDVAYLSRQAVELLTLLKALGSQPQACVFPSILRSSVPLGEATLNHFFKRLDFGVPDFSPHGTRGTAATLLREHGLSRDVVELLLAHAERNKVKRSFVRMFNTLQLNTHFISVIARTRLDHDDIGKIEAAIRAQTEAATASLNKAIDGADALFNAHGITSAASYDITDAETEQAPGSSTEGDVGVMNEAAAAPMVTSETGAEVPFAVEE